MAVAECLIVAGGVLRELGHVQAGEGVGAGRGHAGDDGGGDGGAEVPAQR